MRQYEAVFGKANHASVYEEARREHPELSERETIVLLCERVLSEAEAEPPIPVERIASLRGIVEIEERKQPWAGVLEPRDDHLVVGVRESDGYERKRFTVCHESGHTFFEGFTEGRQFRCNGERTRLEQRCDLAASELLLPRRFFVPDLMNESFDLSTIEFLAGEYQASIEATALRFVDLWPEPALLLCFRMQNKPTERGREDTCEPKLRLSYSFASGHWPYLLRHKSVSDDSPFARAYMGELVSARASLGEIATTEIGPIELQARRYGADGRVLALVRRVRPSTGRG